MKILLSLILSTGVVLVASAQVPPRIVRVPCPTPKVTVGVETPASLPKPWWDTPYLMQLDSLSTTIPVGGKPGLTCIYKGSGREWTVSRPLAPDFKSCTVAGQLFHCTP